MRKSGILFIAIVIATISSYSATAQCTLPSITAQPVNSTACNGGSLTLSVVATGATSYQWYWSGNSNGPVPPQSPPWSGGTTATLTISPLSSSLGGQYWVKVTNSCGTVTSSAATVAVSNQNTIPPTSRTICQGTSTSLTGPSGMTTYSWTGPNGFTSSTQNPTLSNFTPAMSGTYTVTATSGSCTNTGNTTITITPAPVITSPASKTVCDAVSTTLSATVTGATSYQWYWSGNNNGVVPSQSPPWSGQTTQTLTISPVGTGTAGQYWIKATNSCGVTTTSTAATLTVDKPAVSPTTSGTACAGGNVTLIPGITAASYSWTGPNGYSSTASSPVLSNLTTAMSGTYTLTITTSNGCTSPGSVVVTVTALQTPQISITATNVCDGTSGVFVASPMNGGANPGYQWRANGTPINGATASQFSTTISGGQDISCLLTSSLSCVTSTTAVSNIIKTTYCASPLNYVISRTIFQDNVFTKSDVDGLPIENLNETIVYYDGLGRPMQQIHTANSPAKNDLVLPFQYDDFGREKLKFLPYVSNASKRTYKTTALKDPAQDNIQMTDLARYRTGAQYLYYQSAPTVANDQFPYAETGFEPSPLNRVTSQGAPGAAWQPDGTNSYTSTDHTIKKAYETNLDNEVLLWTYSDPTPSLPLGLVNTGTGTTPVYYAANQLLKNKTKDEQRNEIIEYVDREGRTILKRVQATSTANASTTDSNKDANWASTYYIYDDLGHLVCVIPPEATRLLPTLYYQSGATDLTKNTFLSSWAFRYTYDLYNRMTQKQVPGAQTVFMVYDSRYRLALTQDGNQRPNKQWIFTKYDALNRPVLTGMIKTNVVVDQTTMQARVDAYYAGLTGIQNWFETYQGSGVHGYTNNSYPQTDTLNNYLTVTYYDNYNFKSLFVNNGSFDYDAAQLNGTGGYQAQVTTPNSLVTGQVTGTKIRMISTGTWLKAVNYYDNKYRLIQQVADNIKGHTITTTAFDFAGRPQSTKTSLFTGQPITWANVTGGASTTSNNISFNGTGSDWSQGATSVQYLPANTDGWIEATLSQVNVGFILGVGDSGVPAMATVDFGWYVSTGQLNINRGNNIAYGFGNVVSGDVLRIERINGKIYFKKNGVIVYPTGTQTADVSTAQLYFYTTLKNSGAKISNVVVSNTFSGSNSAISTVTKRFTYDHASRLKETWHKIGTRVAGSLTETSEVLLASNTYNELGQLIDKKLHSTTSAATDAKQSVDYRYNIRGWLTSINNAELSNIGTNDDIGDLFGMNLAYNDDLGTGNSANLQYNGNINAIKWSSGLCLGAVKQMGYNFTYDAMNRLTAAASLQAATLNTWAAGQYDENGLSYDLNGNIKTLLRKGKGNALIDNLSYTYASGNQLMSVGDGAATADKDKGFYDGNASGNDYAYDANGNMIQDKNKNLVLSAGQSIIYNHLNLPEKVTKYGNDNIVYLYDATGAKQSQVVTQSGTQKVTEYVGPWVFENNVLQFVQHDEGRIVMASEQKLYTNSCDVVTADLTATNATLAAQTINGEKYIKVTSTSSPAAAKGGLNFTTVYAVTEGERYLFRVKGYFNGAAVTLYAKGNGTDLVWPGTTVPKQALSEAWVEETIAIPNGITQLSLGVLWSGMATTTDNFLINEIEFYKLGVNTAPEYQYYLKDHLGNVRTTFTSKTDVQSNVATMEAANQNAERSAFVNYDRVRVVNSSALFDHTNNPGGNGASIRLSGNANEKTGLVKTLAVMPGDVIHMEVYAKYLDTNTSNWSSALTTLVSNISSGSASVVTDGSNYSTNASNPFPYSGLNGTGSSAGTGPKAYLNYIMFDKDFNPILPATDASQTNFVRMSTIAKENGQSGTPDGVAHELLAANVTAKQPGYMYIYLSNEESSPVEVYFDDFKVTQTKSPVVQTQDYYPFGLVSKTYSRENTVPSVYQYNSKEVQDELNLGWLDYGARMYMSDIGRWGMVDPLSSLSRRWSPYNYALDNPVRFIDPDGMYSTEEWKKDHGVTDSDVNRVYTAPTDPPNTYNFEDSGNSMKLTGMTMSTVNPSNDQPANFTLNGKTYKTNSTQTLRGRDDKRNRIGDFSGVTKLDERQLQVALGWGSYVLYDLYKGNIELGAASESGTNAKLDYKNVVYNMFDINRDDLLEINGKVYNANEAGNFLWGMVLEYHASFISPNFAADLVSQIGQGRHDEPWEQRAITEGRSFGLSLYGNKDLQKELVEIRLSYINGW